jgi:hypothetical protein
MLSHHGSNARETYDVVVQAWHAVISGGWAGLGLAPPTPGREFSKHRVILVDEQVEHLCAPEQRRHTDAPTGCEALALKIQALDTLGSSWVCSPCTNNVTCIEKIIPFRFTFGSWIIRPSTLPSNVHLINRTHSYRASRPVPQIQWCPVALASDPEPGLHLHVPRRGNLRPPTPPPLESVCRSWDRLKRRVGCVVHGSCRGVPM